MKLEDVDKLIQELNLPQGQKEATLKLIDAKVSNDMKEVILEMRSLRDELKMENEGLKREIKTIFWVVGIAMAVITLLITVIGVMTGIKS